MNPWHAHPVPALPAKVTLCSGSTTRAAIAWVARAVPVLVIERS